MKTCKTGTAKEVDPSNVKRHMLLNKIALLIIFIAIYVGDEAI